MVQVLVDRGNEFTDVAEAAPANAFVGEISKPPFHHVQPRTGCGDEVQMEARVPAYPARHPGMFVRPIVVHNEMQIEMGRRLGVNLLEEPDELLMAMPRQAIADYVPIKQVQRGKQGRRAMAFIVMRPSPTAALLHRKAGLGAVQGLDLAFLIHGEHQGLVWRIEIQPHHIVELLDKLGVPAELEGLAQMRFEPMLLPDAAYRGGADPLGVRHGSSTPVRRRRWRGMQRRLHDGADLLGRKTGKATGAGGIALESRYAQPQESCTPQLHCGPRNLQLPRNVLIQHPVCRQADDLGTLHDTQGAALGTRPCRQRRTLFGRQHNGRRQMHLPISTGQ